MNEIEFRRNSLNSAPPQLQRGVVNYPPFARKFAAMSFAKAFVDGGSVDLPASPLPLTAANEKRLGELQQMLAEKAGFVVAVVGPPGCGKKTAIARVARQAGLPLTVVMQNQAWSGTVAQRLRNAAQPDLFGGAKLLLNTDCELAPGQRPKKLASDLATALGQLRDEGGRVFLVCNERTYLLKLAFEEAEGLRTIWWEPFGAPAIRKLLSGEVGECLGGRQCPCNRRQQLNELQIEQALPLCAGDARQALHRRCLLRPDAGVGGKDRAHHNPYQSTRRLLNDHGGGAASAEDVHEDWLAHCLLHTGPALNAAGSFYEDLASLDAQGLLERDWGGDTFEQDNTRQLREVGQDILFLSAKRSKGRAHLEPGALQAPPRRSAQGQWNVCVDDKLKASVELRRARWVETFGSQHYAKSSPDLLRTVEPAPAPESAPTEQVDDHEAGSTPHDIPLPIAQNDRVGPSQAPPRSGAHDLASFFASPIGRDDAQESAVGTCGDAAAGPRPATVPARQPRILEEYKGWVVKGPCEPPFLFRGDGTGTSINLERLAGDTERAIRDATKEKSWLFLRVARRSAGDFSEVEWLEGIYDALGCVPGCENASFGVFATEAPGHAIAAIKKERVRVSIPADLNGNVVEPCVCPDIGNARGRFAKVEAALSAFNCLAQGCRCCVVGLVIEELPPRRNSQKGSHDEQQQDLDGLDMTFEQALDAVLAWGLHRFQAYVANVKLKLAENKRRKEDRLHISPLEGTVVCVQPALQSRVVEYEKCCALVYEVDGDRAQNAWPGDFDEALSDYALKQMNIFLWDPRVDTFKIIRGLDGFFREGHYLRKALLVVGEGGAGKSQSLGRCAKWACIRRGKPQFVFTKAVDPLGQLSHTGELAKSGCIVLTDFELKAARGTHLSNESVKSLFDVEEGGSILDTRYYAANFPQKLPRFFALNGCLSHWGRWFQDYGQYDLALVADALGALTTAELEEGSLRTAEAAMRKGSADVRAQARRACFAFPDPKRSLITEQTVGQLTRETERTLSEDEDRLAEYLAKRPRSQ